MSKMNLKEVFHNTVYSYAFFTLSFAHKISQLHLNAKNIKTEQIFNISIFKALFLILHSDQI